MAINKILIILFIINLNISFSQKIEELDIAGCKFKIFQDNKISIIDSKKKLNEFLSSDNVKTINVDFNKNNLILCHIYRNRGIACNNFFAVQFFQKTFKMTIYEIGDDALKRHFVKAYLLSKGEEISKTLVEYKTYPSMSKYHADSICNNLINKYEK